MFCCKCRISWIEALLASRAPAETPRPARRPDALPGVCSEPVVTHERARGFSGDAAPPGGARETVGHLDVVTVRHPDQRSEPVEGGVGPPFDPPEAQPVVIAAATVQHAPPDQLRRFLR